MKNNSIPIITADFSKKEEHPLIKTKFGVYICTYVSLKRMLRDIGFLHEINPAGVRYDPGWGFGNNNNINSPREFNAPQISGSVDDIKINFDEFDKLSRTLHNGNYDIMYVHAYNPIPLQDNSNDIKEKLSSNLNMYSNWNTKPNNMTAWEKINKEYAKHCLDNGQRVKYYEVWNEPDLQPTFFTGSKEDYFEIYKYGSRGIKQGNPDALVGGPAISDDTAWLSSFLDYVTENKLPLDFISFHNYGSPDNIISRVRNILKDREELGKVDFMITEYNSFVPATEDFSRNGRIEKYEAASRMLHDFKYFLSQQDIKTVYWAQYDDPEVFGEGVDRCGMISLEGHKKASFNAFKIYADMPLNRNLLVIDNTDVEGMASSDEHKACVVLWNMSEHEKKIHLYIKGIKFEFGDFKLYRIDSRHASYVDNLDSEELDIVEKKMNIETHAFFWDGTIPEKGVAYIVIEENSII